MTGLHVTVPLACFRKGLAREYLETEPLPPPATCYGFLLALVGEVDRTRHIGARVTAAMLSPTEISVILRRVWRIKSKKMNMGSGANTRPDFQQILTATTGFLELVIWIDSTEETAPAPRLEERVMQALDPARRNQIKRFGGLSLGESTHLVDEVSIFPPTPDREGRIFLLDEKGTIILPVWVDHVGSQNTHYATGNIVTQPLVAPPLERMPKIEIKNRSVTDHDQVEKKQGRRSNRRT